MAEKTVDWERVELDYRAGILSLREIAAANGITHGAINKRAKRDGWDRDLSARIKAKADALVSKQAVSILVSGAKLATEREVIEANAAQIAKVRGEHRSDIGRARTLVLSLLGELEAETRDLEAFRQLGEFMAAPDEKGVDKLNEAYHKAISLPARVTSVKALSEALKNLIGLEREAYAIDKGKEPEAPSGAIEPTNKLAREIAYALHLGMKNAANDPKSSQPRQAAS